MTIESFSIDYDAKNDENVFARGDTITGRIILVLSSETKIACLSIKAKGKADVLWTEHYGQYTNITYHAKDKYFSIENVIFKEGREDGSEVLTIGRHVYPFSFQIPDEDMPTSFKGARGKIIYSLKAKLTRSLRVASKAKSEFTLVSKADMSLPDLMEPQNGNKDKDVTFFASGNLSLNIHTERMGYLQGEELKVRAEIVNNSTRSVTPKFYLYEKQCFYAQGKRNVHTKNILKDKGDPVLAGSQQNITKVLTIPPTLPATIFNCSILKLEYRLKVILDIKLSRNPEIKLPIVVLPATQTPQQQPGMQELPPPYSDFGFEPFATPTQPAWNNATQFSAGAYSLLPAYPSKSDFGEKVMEEKK